MWRAPSRRPPSPGTKIEVIRLRPHQVEGRGGELLGADRARVRPRAVARRLLEVGRVLLEQPAQVAVGDHAGQSAGGVDDRGHAHHLPRHLVEGLGHRRGRAHARDAVAGPHEVPDLQEAPAEAAGRMQRGEVFGLEPPPFRDRERQRVAHREHRRRRSRGREVQRAGFPRDRDGDRPFRRPRDRGARHAGHRDRPDLAGARELEQAHDLGRLARVGQGEDDVAGHEHAEVAVARLAGMEKVGGRSGRGEGGGDLLGDQPGLADPRQAEAAGGFLDGLDRRLERRPEVVDLAADGVRLDLEDPARRFEVHGRILSRARILYDPASTWHS